MANTMQKVADDYGYQLAFLKAVPEVYAIFNQAVNGGWDATRFVAAVRNTKWYKTHSESYRTALQEKYTDPGSYNKKVSDQLIAIQAMQTQMGSSYTAKALKNLAETSTLFGWGEQQLKDYLAKGIHGTGGGEAATAGAAVRSMAFRNGLNVSEKFVTDWSRRIASGKYTTEQMQVAVRSMAKTLAPGFAKELDAGMDLYDVASPYMQSMAKTLELNPADINLFNPVIRKALNGGAPDGKNSPTSTPLWQFERDLKNDPRWLKTQGAQDELMNVTHSILQSFGLSAL